MRYSCFNSLLILLFIFSVSCGAKKQKCSEFYDKYQSLKAQMHGKEDTAILIQALDNIILEDSKCVDAILTRADLLFSKGKVPKAISDYKIAISVDTGNIYAAYQLGMAYEVKEMHDTAIIFFQKAINSKSTGNGMMDYPDRLKDLSREKSKYDIESTELMFRQGISFYYKKDMQNAYNNFNFCIIHGYKLEMAYLYRGSLYFQTRQKEKGCTDFMAAQKLGSKDAEKYLNRYCK